MNFFNLRALRDSENLQMSVIICEQLRIWLRLSVLVLSLVSPLSEGRGCLGEGRLGVPGQVWEFGFLLSFPLFPRENRSSKNVWENTWKSQTSIFQTSAAFFSAHASAHTGMGFHPRRLLARRARMYFLIPSCLSPLALE